MMATIPLKVLELACSRICHDLVSPVGAINNGVELSQELSDEMAGQAMDLIAESGRRAAARLQVFRLAFGAAGGQAGLSAGDVRSVLADCLSGGKIVLVWPEGAAPPDQSWPAGTGRLIILSALLAEEALTYGGRVTPDFNARPSAIVVTAEGRAANLSPPSLSALRGCRAAESDLTPRTVIAYLARRFADAAGITLAVESAASEPDGPAVLRLVIGWPAGR